MQFDGGNKLHGLCNLLRTLYGALTPFYVSDLDNLIDALVVVDGGRILVNATADRITEKLAFRNVRDDEPALFAEESIRGRWGVVLNERGEDSKLDMELFFNAVLQHPEKMRDILK